MATTYHEFSSQAVSEALAAAQEHNQTAGLESVHPEMSVLHGGEFAIAAQCITVSVSGNKICLSLPLGIGKICLPIPVNIKNGTSAQACLTICTTWGFPTGVKVTITVGGIVIVTKKFGKC